MKQLEEIAADWVARRNGGGLAAEEQKRLDAWLAADPRHRAAFTTMAAAWNFLQEPRRAGETPAVWAALQEGARRRKSRAVATLAIAAALVVGVFTFQFWRTHERGGGQAVAVRPDIRTLPDGSTIEMNSGADIAVAFTAGERRVRLVRGEALFEVTKDPARPFVVTAGAVEVRAVGTAFTVRRDEGRINVVVTEGTVAVDRVDAQAVSDASRGEGATRSDIAGSGATAPAEVEALRPHPRSREPVYVEVGRQLAIPIDGAELPALQVKPISADELAAALAWRSRRIEFNDAQLPEVVALFNRQNRVQLEIVGSALVKRSITGVFWSDDPEGFVRLLESGFGVSAQRVGDTIRLTGQ